MFFHFLLYAALTVFGVGMVYKIAGWFSFRIGAGTTAPPAGQRISAAVKGISAVLLSARLPVLIRVFIGDVLLQLRIWKEDRLRWLMHMLIFAGFTFLLVTHALGRLFVPSLYDRFYLLPNPVLIGAGAMALAGVLIAAWRRFVRKVPRLSTRAMDHYILIILALIMLSGIAMEATKLTSYNHYPIFWDIHILSCLLGLAYLPFSKMLHVFSTPASLLANAVMGDHSRPANIMTRQVMELDACTHCCTCSLRCSVAVAYDSLGNEHILPSERMLFLRDYIAHKRLNERGLAAIQQGIYLCTNCDRCTVVCPAGIDLRDLWFNVREEMIQGGRGVPLMLTPFSFYRGLHRRELAPERYDHPLQLAQEELTGRYERVHQPQTVIPLTADNRSFRETAPLSARAGTFTYCFTCENCSTVCPVAGNYDNPAEQIDLLPHQIIRSLALGLNDLAMGSRMLWYCLTCYQCQEHCPQGVKVTDIFYELKNLAASAADRSSGRAVAVKRAV